MNAHVISPFFNSELTRNPPRACDPLRCCRVMSALLRYDPMVTERALLSLTFVFLGPLAAPHAADQPPTPLFQYRVLMSSFRKAPANTPERIAADLRVIVPDDIRPWTAISLVLSAAGYNYLDGDTPLEFARRFNQQGYRFLTEIADPGIPDPPSRRIFLRPEDIRAIFAACPNCIGVETGETFWAFTGGDNPKIDQWLLDVLAVCAENRRWFLLGEGTWNKGHWTRFFFKHYDRLRANQLGQWLVPMHKNTKPWATLQNVSALQGAWMTGLIGNYGLWNDQWAWTYSSFGNANEFPPYNKPDHNERKIPYTYFLRQWLWAISQGAAFSSTEDPLAFSREGKANSTFAKYLHPFIKGIGEHRITPSREAVLRKTKAIVDPFGTYATAKGPWTYDPLTVFFTYLDEPTAFAPKSYDPFTMLFRNTYGFSPEYDGTTAAGRMFPREPSLPDRLTRETLPNTARYYCLPILPHPSAQAPHGMKAVKLADTRADAAVKAVFDPLYPPDPHGSVAYAVEVDDSFFVLNGNENRDVDQRFKVPLGEGALQWMEGDLPFQNLVFGKREGKDRFWFQANGYHGDGTTPGQRYACTPKPTVITFLCSRSPAIQVEDGKANRLTVLKPWDERTRAVILSFDHADGAVNFTIGPAPATDGADGHSVVSPDGRIRADAALEGGRPQWQVTLDGKALVQPSSLGLELVRDPFRGPLVLERVERASRDVAWHPVWGDLSEVHDRYNEMLVTLRESRVGGRRFQVALRAYNEGAACRYIVPSQPGLDRITIKRRLTEYCFGSDRTIYQNRNCEYGTVSIATMSKSEGAVTVDAGGGRFVALTDADRADFAQAAWERSKAKTGTIVGTLRSPAEGTLPFRTSWEVVIVAPTAAKLYENRHLVENLNAPCAMADTSWIRPGEAISQIRNARMVTSETKTLMDFASKHNVEYVEIDHSWCGAETKWTADEIAFFEKSKSKFWDDKPEWRSNVGGNPMAAAKGWVPFRPKADSGGNYVDLDVAEAATYGNRLSPKVGLCLYVRGAVIKEFGGEHPADDVFATYERWGIAGVKLGFVPSGSQQNERAVADVVRKAANYRLIVNIHDGYFPSGLSRIYPNLMNVEGVAGDEAEHSIAPAVKSLHDIMLPFTRCLMGPVDYTPEMFKASKTHAHQVAMLGVYNGRPTIRGGMKQWSPGGAGGGEVEFVERLPGLFDEMKVITDLGKFVTVARRRGDTWFVASMSDGHARSYGLRLDFLQPGTSYQASIYADTPGKQQTSHSRIAVSSESVVPIAMEPNGGHLMIIEPVVESRNRNPEQHDGKE